MTAQRKERLTVGAIVGIVATVFTIFGSIIGTTTAVVKSFTEQRDDIRYIKIVADSMRTVPPRVQKIENEIHWMTDSTLARGNRIAKLEQNDGDFERRLRAIEAQHRQTMSLSPSVDQPSYNLTAQDGVYTYRQ